MPRTGPELALLLLGGFRALVDASMVELAARGFPDHRPGHDFAMRAIIAGADSASDLGRRMATSKQAAAKTIAVLVDRGYLATERDSADARRVRLVVTARGEELVRQGEAVFDALRDRWAARIGLAELETLEDRLALLVGDGAIRLDAPGWAAQAPD